jgi:multimeric flavodoxin WrbA
MTTVNEAGTTEAQSHGGPPRVAIIHEDRVVTKFAARVVADGVEVAGGEPTIFAIGCPPATSDADIAIIKEYDAMIFVTSSSFGRPTAQMASFLDDLVDVTGHRSVSGRLAGILVMPGDQPGGREPTFLAIVANLMQLGMVIVGPPHIADGAEQNGALLRAQVIEMEAPHRDELKIDDHLIAQAHFLGQRVSLSAVKMVG